ncbi:unnamed protein product, partial [Symbiodinium sp. KB8]
VTLEMPGGEAQLAKWHRLGHLQSVAGRFAEVMAKPSTMRTVKDHAKELLLEADEKAKREAENAKREAENAKREAEEQAEKEKREAEEQAAKEKREAEEQAAARESRGKVLARLDKAIGVVHKDLLEATAAQLPERGDQSVEDFVFAQMQPPGGLSAAVRMAGSSPKELSVVPQAVEQPWWLLWPGSEARKWLASRMAGDIAALTQPTNRLGETNGRAVFGTRGVGKTSMLAAGAVAAGVFSSIPSLPEGSRRIVPVYLNMGHAAYLYESAAKHGRFKPRIDLDPDARKWDGSSWWSDFKDYVMHSDKLAAQAALPPIQHLAEFAEAIKCIGAEFAAPKLFRAACEWSSDETTRLRFAELVLQHGGVLRSLVADNKPTNNELPLFKMRSDISADAGRLAIARIFYDRLIRKWPGLKSESVVGMLASNSLRSVTEVGIDFAELVATINERVASSHGQQREMLAATEVESTLSSLSDSGVLTLSGSFWAPASWTSVLAILLSAEANVELPYEQRVHLRYPTIGSTTTEPAMA